MTALQMNNYIREYIERCIGAGLSIGYDNNFDIMDKERVTQNIISSMPPIPTVNKIILDVASNAWDAATTSVVKNTVSGEGYSNFNIDKEVESNKSKYLKDLFGETDRGN